MGEEEELLDKFEMSPLEFQDVHEYRDGCLFPPWEFGGLCKEKGQQ
jgi:hypothetical protein